MGEYYQNTALIVKVEDDDPSAFLAAGLPLPSAIEYAQRYYIIAWLIKGYRDAAAAREFYYDIAAAVAAALGGQLTNDIRPDRIENRAYDLAAFRDIERVKKSNAGHSIHDGRDLLFDTARVRIYDAQRRGQLTPAKAFDIVYTANVELSKNKPHADLRSKARNMYEWTTDNIPVGSIGGYALWGKERRAEYMREYRKKDKGMSRTDHIKRVHESRKLNSKARVLEASRGLTVRYKNGNLNITAIAEQAQVSRPTARKYLRELGLI